jgi:putative oxidoreductase
VPHIGGGRGPFRIKAPRLCAVLLAGSLVPTTLAGHAFWTVEDPAARKSQRVQFLKNMAMIGGLLFAVLDKPAKPAALSEASDEPAVISNR